jgi:hypothetical protein
MEFLINVVNLYFKSFTFNLSIPLFILDAVSSVRFVPLEKHLNAYNSEDKTFFLPRLIREVLILDILSVCPSVGGIAAKRCSVKG